jgi:outer membrane protein assembly factor BamB
MKILKNKITVVIVMLLMLSMTVSMFALPLSFAQYTAMPDRKTDTTVGVSPTLIGLGQEVLVNVFVYPAPSGPTYNGQYLVAQYNGGFQNVSVTIKRPDGTQETFKPVDITLEAVGVVEPGTTQIVGHLMFNYKPATVGNYSITASFPGQTYTTDAISNTIKLSVYYQPSSSTSPTTFTVQQERVSGGILDGSPYSSLPQNYWENPVQTDNREWAAISGDWPQRSYDVLGSNYNPYSTAPASPHILWARKLSSSGLPGGFWGSYPNALSGSASGSAPAPLLVAVVDGIIFRQLTSITMATETAPATVNFEAVDLRTGKLLWTAPGRVLQAQRLDLPFQTGSQHNEGSISSWIWGITGSSWIRYDTYDGHVLQTITGAPTDLTITKFEDGDPIAWVVQASLSTYNKTRPLKLDYVNLIKWNFTKMVSTVVFSNIYSNKWSDGIEWNVTALTGDLVEIGDNNFRGPICYPFREANVVIVRTPNAMQIMAGYDYTTGAFLWKNNQTVLNLDVVAEGYSTSSSGPHIMKDGASPNYVAYDVKTGREIWRASGGELPWGAIPCYSSVYHDGVNYFGSYDGYVYAYDSTDGQLIWKSDYVGEEFETVYNNQPFNGHPVGADGKLYYASATTYQMMPRPRFNVLACIDEATGSFLWKLPMGIMPSAVADGYLVGEDIDNGIQYVIGKGQTATTVAAPSSGVVLGGKVMITGTVMDESPGAPNTPAVSDADMVVWMDHLYGQNATLLNNPPSVRGVDVTLDVLDSNGNRRNIGTTTSDSNGFFKFSWTPDIEGDYTIYASFAGSESYWPSNAVAALVVEPIVQTESPENPQSIDSNNLLYSILGGVVAAIVIGLVAIFLSLRKK